MIKVWDYLKEYELLRDYILKAVDEVFKGGDAFKTKNCPRPWDND